MLGEFGAVALSSLSQAWSSRWAGISKMGFPFKYAAADASKIYCANEPFDVVENCKITKGRESQTIVSDLDGTLLRSRSSFPYFMLIAFEAGSPLRAAILLLLSPLAWVMYNFISESAGIKILIFLSFAGLRLSAIETAARGVLSKFYLEDMHSRSYRLFIACGRRCVVTANPRIMVEPFLKEYLEVEAVMGTEIQTTSGGYATGFVSASTDVLVGLNKRSAVKKYFGNDAPDIGLGDRESDYPFMSFCKEAYIVPSDEPVEAVPKNEYLKPLIFHDGRLVCRPTPLMSLAILLWTPIGIVLAVIRIVIGLILPMWLAKVVEPSLGVFLIVKGIPPNSHAAAAIKKGGQQQQQPHRGVLFVCSHRTLLDPIFLSVAAGRRVSAVTYSISRISEILAPIRTVRLTRCRDTDAQTMTTLLKQGDLAVCPEGTTCREPFLLRFSSLFAELADEIVPVTMNTKIQLFHGTTARGWKSMDPLFFFMNPAPSYEVTFLEQLPIEMTCTGGKSSHEVANYIQKELAKSLGFQCTDFTRKDKYRVLAGTDGTVPASSSSSSSSSSSAAAAAKKQQLAIRSRIVGC